MHNNLLEQIRALRLGHMSNALELQWSQPMTYTSLSFEERLGLLLEHENQPLQPGTGYPLVKALLGLNQHRQPDDKSPLVEVVVM